MSLQAADDPLPQATTTPPATTSGRRFSTTAEPEHCSEAVAPISVGSTAQPRDNNVPIPPQSTSQCGQEVNNNNDLPEGLVDLSDEGDSDENKTKKRKLRSAVWDHFKQKKINGRVKAICNYCNKDLVCGSSSGTNHLRTHTQRCPRRNQKDIGQMMLNLKKESEGNMAIGTYAFDQEASRKSMAKMLILHELPLSFVEYIGFRDFLKEVQPLFKVVSRNTIKADILKIYDCEQIKIMTLLERNKSRIALTTDMWTSNQKKGFMAITAHYIDDRWRLQSRIIRFIYVPCPHTAIGLANVLMNCVFHWNLDRKLCTLTVDNCTTNDAMMRELKERLPANSLLADGEFFHVRCCAHILNLIVKDGLKIIENSVETIRNSVAFWSATQKRKEKFDLAATQLKIPCSKTLALDCDTRWNSTYLMLKTAIRYSDVFPRMKHRETQYKCVPTEDDWNIAKQICDRLKKFYEVTELFSGTKYPTANLFFTNICQIKLSMSDWIESQYREIRLMAVGMTEKFDKYWTEIHGILAIATVLDPRFKLKLVEFYFKKIFGEVGAKDEISKISEVCERLVSHYQSKKNGSSSQGVSFSSRSSHQSEGDSREDDLGDYDLFVSSIATTETKTELEFYLEESVIPRSPDFDILGWWKANSSKYPLLAKVARDVLAVPISTVASESAFSTGGRFVTPHRSRLHHKTLEALMCTRDWLWADIHEQSNPTHPYKGCCTSLDDEEVEEEESVITDACTYVEDDYEV